jgi:hypothetical protein
MESDDDEGDEALARLTPSEQLEFTGL